ncbi:UNVERIFIED_CONTAM: hypothetical protein Sangu_2339600 [Sesamum angustifolium]|uniref:Uncharacterized protein n=1 Tax=Sesamum angustifolium TaxID=2727405 RepID=A0AAW2L8L9_9LAMI
MQTVGMHKRQRDNMERFQHSLETINHRFHQVFFALCALAPELITCPSFTKTHTRIANNPNFYPFFKDCVGTMNDKLVPAWVPRVHKNRYRSRKGGLAQNVLAICDFDMNFTYVYTGWERSAADARVVEHAVSQDRTFPFPPINMEYRRYLESTRFPQDLHWTLNVEQRFMWMIVDDNTRAPMRSDALAEAQMGHWARGLRRYFGNPYTRDQHYPLASWYYQYPEPHYPSMLEVWDPIRLSGVHVEDQGVAQDNESSKSLRSPVRGGVDAPIVISDSAAPSVQTHTHIASWDAVENVVHGDGGPRMACNTSLAE